MFLGVLPNLHTDRKQINHDDQQMRIQNVKYRRGLLHARCWREIAAGDIFDNGNEFYGFRKCVKQVYY